MAHTDPLSQSVRQSVAGQLGEFLVGPQPALLTTRSALPQPELAESLAICFLTAEQVAQPPADLATLAEPSGTWHHQVHTAAGPTHLARSSQSGFAESTLQVEQWVESPIAARLEEAMAWVDETLPEDDAEDDALVRLLVIPAYYVHALLLLRGPRQTVVLVDQPASFKQLKYEKEYELGTFLKLLAKERPSGTFQPGG